MDNIKDPENTIIMEVKGGTVLIELLPDIAPLHCERMKTLVRSGLYDNVCFHRVIEGFMAQFAPAQQPLLRRQLYAWPHQPWPAEWPEDSPAAFSTGRRIGSIDCLFQQSLVPASLPRLIFSVPLPGRNA